MDADVVVVGAGPGGASTAYWLAKSGARVALLEKKSFPRDKTCGDGLTPRSVRQLEDMGLATFLEGSKLALGPRYIAPHAQLDIPWPLHPDFPAVGRVVRRSVLDDRVAANAAEAGVEMFQAHQVVGVDVDPSTGTLRSVAAEGPDGTRTFTAPHFVIADGSASRTARMLGHVRDRSYPIGIAIRGYFDCEPDGDWLDSFLDLRLLGHRTIPGYGWAFPTGDGQLNVGLGVLSTYKRWKELNTTNLLHAFVTEYVLPRWPIDPNAIKVMHGGKLPLGGSVEPVYGPNYVLVGDAVGLINPFNGEGIAYALESGRIAAEVLAAVRSGATNITDYPRQLQQRLGGYYRAGLFILNIVGRPWVLRELMRLGMQSQSLMEWATRIMCNLTREGEHLKAGEFALGVLEKGLETGVLRGRMMKAANPALAPPGPAREVTTADEPSEAEEAVA